jgi:hypothetical protein
MPTTLQNLGILFNNGTFQSQGVVAGGAAPLFAARAWCNFNGTTTTPSGLASANVSSVTRLGTGNYFVTYAVAMTDAAGTVAVTCNSAPTDGSVFARIANQAFGDASGCPVETMRPGVGAVDSGSVHFIMFR